MIRIGVKGPNFETIYAMLDRVQRPDLGTLGATLREIMIEDNRDGLLAGLNADGDVAEPVKESTIRRGRGGDGPVRVPREGGSRMISTYGVEVAESVDRLVLIGSWSGAPFVHYFTAPTRNMPIPRDPVGIRPSGQERIALALDGFAVDLMGGF